LCTYDFKPEYNDPALTKSYDQSNPNAFANGAYLHFALRNTKVKKEKVQDALSRLCALLLSRKY
jgi:hypothetical protein